MLISVTRIKSDVNATLSVVAVNGRFVCFGLEDEYRARKVPGETRILAGNYRVTLRTVGGFHGRYTKKFGAFHRGMLWVRDVPGFEYILIHIGNSEKDTAGCLLVGLNASTHPSLYVGNSTGAYKRLYALVVDAAQANDLRIEYVDLDR